MIGEIEQLAETLREAIVRLEKAGAELRGDRTLRRVLALLWSAYDELALLERADPTQPPAE